MLLKAFLDPKTPQEPPTRTQDAPKTPQDVSRRPKTLPRRPRRSQDAWRRLPYTTLLDLGNQSGATLAPKITSRIDFMFEELEKKKWLCFQWNFGNRFWEAKHTNDQLKNNMKENTPKANNPLDWTSGTRNLQEDQWLLIYHVSYIHTRYTKLQRDKSSEAISSIAELCSISLRVS